MAITTAQAVRDYFTSAGSATAARAAADMGRPRTAVYAAMRDLLDTGWLRRDELIPGLYHRRPQVPETAGRDASLQVKIWRAVRITKSFTNWDLALYTGATIDYVKRYLAFLQTKGFVKKAGKLGPRTIYQMTATAPQATPKMLDRKDRPAQDATLAVAVELLRHIREGDRSAAMSAYAQLGRALSVRELQA